MSRLKGKSAIVFGGGSANGEINNGLATALIYAREGASVTVADISESAVDGSVEKIRKELSVAGKEANVRGVVADVTSEDSVKNAFETHLQAFGRVDVLHNNVGIARMGGPIEMELDEWNFVLSTNLTSAYLTTKVALPHMLRQGSGSIVNIASVGGMRYIGYNYPSYSATKGALIQFTQNIALQYASKGIRANCVSPGYIETPMMYKQIAGNYSSTEEMVAKRNALSPPGKMGDSFDVAYASLFLASDEAKYVNGITLPVDGGLIQQAAHPVQ